MKKEEIAEVLQTVIDGLNADKKIEEIKTENIYLQKIIRLFLLRLAYNQLRMNPGYELSASETVKEIIHSCPVIINTNLLSVDEFNKYVTDFIKFAKNEENIKLEF